MENVTREEAQGSASAGRMHPETLAERDDREDRGALFSNIYRREARYVSRIIRQLGVPRHEIEDAVQEVFVVLHRRLDDIEDRAGVRAWLHTASVRVCQNRRRAYARRSRYWGESFGSKIDDMHDPSGRSPDEQAGSNETADTILSAVERLSHKKREVFMLAAIERFTLLEIAERVHISPNTAASRLRAARSEIRWRLSLMKLAR
jgi:RNA polymerase sigma-70 factor (ECF subfamily)